MNLGEIKEILTQNDEFLLKSKTWLVHSYEICNQIGKKTDYSLDEMDAFEALNSRFARASDLLIHQMFRTIQMIELEPGGTILDRINRAEKLGYINSAEDMKRIREIRNTIVHEYNQKDVIRLFHDILDETPILIESIEMTHSYIEKYLTIS